MRCHASSFDRQGKELATDGQWLIVVTFFFFLCLQGPPTSLADADASLVLSEEEAKEVYSCSVSQDLQEWKSGLLKDAPTSHAAREELWNKLRLRESELPEKAEEEEAK